MTVDEELELAGIQLQRLEVQERADDKKRSHELALKDKEVRLARANYVACGSDRALTVIFACVPWIIGHIVCGVASP